eukprot:m.134584 g.134584  ORF g.134584 m.134584 type:complete len:259 (+) comp38148_c0_seq5:200-976(+)
MKKLVICVFIQFYVAISLGAHLRTSFIQSVNLASMPAEFSTVADQVVVGRQILGGLNALNSTQREDVIDSVLIAQLAATHDFPDGKSDPDAWYNRYKEVLGNIGWVLDKFSFSRFETHLSTVEVDEVVLAALGAIQTVQERADVAKVVNALKDKENSAAFALFNEYGGHEDSGNFQVSQAFFSSNDIGLKTGASYLTMSSPSKDLFFAPLASSSIVLYEGSESMVLNEDVYSAVRQSIKEKLVTKRTTAVANIATRTS